MRRWAAVGLGALLAAAAQAAKAPAFKVTSLAGGELTANGKLVTAGAELAEGAALRLDAGEAILEFGSEGRLKLTGPAELRLGPRRVTLASGRLLSVLNKLKGSFSVATPIAVAAVRGTEFFVEARDDGRTYLCLCAGVLEVSGTPGVSYRKAIRSEHHAAYIYSRHGKRLDRNAWKMEHHSDAEIGGLK